MSPSKTSFEELLIQSYRLKIMLPSTWSSPGRDIRLAVVPVDPRDLVRGDYVILSYPMSQLRTDQLEGEDSTALCAREAICGALPALRGRPDALSVCLLDGRLHVWLNVVCGSEGRVEKLESALTLATGTRMELLRKGEEWLLFSETPVLRLETARACVMAAGEQVSGDGAAWERLSAGQYLLAVSDGMGSGREAGRESSAALELLLRALRAGSSRHDALRLVNGSALENCPIDEPLAPESMWYN